MASTYTTRLRIELQADNENDSTWGQKTNDVFQRLELAVAGYTSIPLSDGNYTLSVANSDSGDDEASVYFLKFTGTLSAARNIVVPTASGRWVVWNATTGGYALTLKTSGGTGANCANGYLTTAICDGTNVYPLGVPVSTLGVPLFPDDLAVVDDLTVGDDAAIGGDLTVTGTGSVIGNFSAGADAAVTGKLTVAKSVVFSGTLTPDLFSTDQDNYAPTGHADAVLFRVTTDTVDAEITGLAGGVAGRRVTVANTGPVQFILMAEHADSSEANRFAMASDVALAENDTITFIYDGTSTRWRPERSASVGNATTGTPGLVQLANRTAVEAGSSSTLVSPVNNLKYLDSVSKAWVNFNGADATIRDSFNVSGVTRHGTGDYTVTFATDFADTNYAFFITADHTSGSVNYSSGGGDVFAKAAGTLRFRIRDSNGSPVDVAQVNVMTMGTLVASL